MHDENCETSDSYFKHTCLCVEMSLRGLYRFAKIRPNFFDQMQLFSKFMLYRNNLAGQNEFKSFMLENKILINYCMMENITFMLQNNPSLIYVLEKNYSMNPFFIISRIYMDMFRGIKDLKNSSVLIQFLVLRFAQPWHLWCCRYDIENVTIQPQIGCRISIF